MFETKVFKSILIMAKSGQDQLFDKLSKESQEHVNKMDAIRSIQKFTSDKKIEINDFYFQDENKVNVTITSFTEKKYYQLQFVKEDDEWKLVWSIRAYEKYRHTSSHSTTLN